MQNKWKQKKEPKRDQEATINSLWWLLACLCATCLKELILQVCRCKFWFRFSEFWTHFLIISWWNQINGHLKMSQNGESYHGCPFFFGAEACLCSVNLQFRAQETISLSSCTNSSQLEAGISKSKAPNGWFDCRCRWIQSGLMNCPSS